MWSPKYKVGDKVRVCNEHTGYRTEVCVISTVDPSDEDQPYVIEYPDGGTWWGGSNEKNLKSMSGVVVIAGKEFSEATVKAALAEYEG